MSTWQKIPNFPDYSVSDYGHVRRDTPTKRNPLGGNVLKPGTGKQGHKYVNLRRNNKAYSVYVHRLVLQAFVGDCPADKTCCAHKDGDPSNNRLENLRWATHAENSLDSVIHGTSGRPGGEKHFRAKLTKQTMSKIREMSHEGYSLRSIGREVGVAHNTVSAFLSGKSYKTEQVK